MIWESLVFITGKLNTTLRNRYNVQQDLVKLTSLSNADSHAADADNKILVSLVNIEPEYIAGDKNTLGKQAGVPDLYVNLYILVCAYSSVENYEQSLKMLSGIISFFHANPVLNAQAETGMPAGVEQLNLE